MSLQPKKFSCQYCDRSFQANSYLRRHIRQSHSNGVLPEVPRGRKPKNDNHVRCDVCSVEVCNSRALLYHRRQKHPSPPVRKRLSAEKHTLEFASYTEFIEWKKAEEDASLSQYVKNRGVHTRKLRTTWQAYYCHRSGRHISNRRSRHLKVQGSCKIGRVCPAAMFVKVSVSGSVMVSYYPQHRGHDCDLAHTRLRKEQRLQIAGKLSVGIPFEDVLDSLHSMNGGDGVNSMHLVTKKDLNNIAREFGINKSVVLHKNDADSVAAWIERTKLDNTTANLVRFVKFQGEESAVLRKDDFILVLSSDAQVVGARQFCGPMREVCMDSTHGMNAYDFQLTTLLCIDEHGEGFPVAFCYSSRVDEVSMRVFLQAVHDALGYQVEDAVLMTDDTEVYSNAWHYVMGPPAVRLLCTWHVDRAWRKNLQRVKGDQNLKAIIYKTIRTLMEITDQAVFSERLHQFLSAAAEDVKTAEFADYFRREYASRPQLWTYAHRMGLKVHHNMHLEAMHRVIKHVHLQGRKVRRLDKSIHALMRFLRSKMSDRLLKLHRGKWTRHVGTIRKRHAASSNLSADSCDCLEAGNVFTVTGSHNELYTVRRSQAVPHEKPMCPLSCEVCNICVHTFSCTCLDSALRNTVCKHIHLIVQTFQLQNEAADVRSDCADVDEPADSVPASPENLATESDAIVSAMTADTRDTAAHLLRAETAWATIRSVMEMDSSLAPVAAEHMCKISALMTAMLNKPQEPGLPQLPSSCEPANKRAPTQRRFSSNRKTKRPKVQLGLSKPSNDEQQFLLSALSGTAEVVSRQPELDHDYSFATTTHVIDFEHSYSGGSGVVSSVTLP